MKQRVGNDGPRNRGLYQHVFSGVKGSYRDNQLGQIAERRVEQSADRVTRPFGDRFGCVAQKGRERHDCQDSKDEKGRVSGWSNCFPKQHGRYEGEHPQQWAVPDFLEQKVHGSVSPPQQAASPVLNATSCAALIWLNTTIAKGSPQHLKASMSARSTGSVCAQVRDVRQRGRCLYAPLRAYIH